MKNLPSLEGLWWAPDDPETKLTGRLVEEDGQTLLYLISANSGVGSFSRQEPKNYEVIHGRAFSGESVSLLDCFEISSSGTVGVEQRMTLASYVLVGGLVPQQREIKGQFAELCLTWPVLKRWFRHSGVHVEVRDDASLTIRYEPRESIEFALSDGSHVHFGFGSDPLPMDDLLADQVKFRPVVWVSVKPEHPRDIHYFLGVVEELTHFFSICMLEYSEPERIVLLGNFKVEIYSGRAIHPRLTLYRNTWLRPQSDRAPHPMDFLVPFDALKDSLADIMERWHKLAAEISSARALYFSSLYGKTQYIESSFLSLVQSAEVFHRRHYGGTYLSNEQYHSEVLPSLKAAIPGSLKGEVREAFRERLVHLNEFSLSKRLNLMVCRHKEVFEQYVPNTTDVIRGIVGARNHFTHYSSPSSGLAPDVNDLPRYIDVLRMLIELEMMAESGVDPSALHRHARESQKYRWMFPPRGRERSPTPGGGGGTPRGGL